MYWPKSNLAVIPLQTYSGEIGGATFDGAAGLSICASTLGEVGRVVHQTAERGQVPIDRSFVIGDRLYTLSYLGVQSSSLANFGALSYTAFN